MVPAAMLFRLGAVLLIATLLHQHSLRITTDGQRPIRLSEVRAFLPEAHRLSLNSAPNGGLRVLDSNRNLVGFANRTMPHCRDIKGYSGPSDMLLVFDAGEQLRGISFRHSYDTPSHVEDVNRDYLFMEQWNGKSREEIADQWGENMTTFAIVSGASRTSEAVIRSITLRAGVGDRETPPIDSFVFRWQDAMLIVCVALGLMLSFVRQPWLQRRKFWIHLLMVIYIGLISADLIAQSLVVSWVEHGVPWNTLPGLVILVAAAFLIPWSTGKPVYCTHVCPHGHAQRWLMKVIPAKRRPKLGTDEKWSFSAYPGLLLATVLLVAFLKLPIDLAGLEPFDAWTIKGVGIATVSVAIIGLFFSLFIPMGYCRYGCPTGFMLELVRRDKQGFSRRDIWLGALTLISAALYVFA